MSPSRGEIHFLARRCPLADIAGYYPSVRTAIPIPRVGYPRLTAPFATSPASCSQGFVRLACLIHAANVRSEPGSNPSNVILHAPRRGVDRIEVSEPPFAVSCKGTRCDLSASSAGVMLTTTPRWPTQLLRGVIDKPTIQRLSNSRPRRQELTHLSSSKVFMQGGGAS